MHQYAKIDEVKNKVKNHLGKKLTKVQRWVTNEL